MNGLNRIKWVGLSLALVLSSVSAASQPLARATELHFLLPKSSGVAYGLDSAFDPTPFLGELQPPYEAGGNVLTPIHGLPDVPALGEPISLGGDGAVLAFSLSPDGDSAAAVRIRPNELLILRGFGDGQAVVESTVALDGQPLSLAFSPSGDHLAIGLQGMGEASVAIVDMFADTAEVREIVGLGVSAVALDAVEAVEFAMNGRSLLAQFSIHNAPAGTPAFFAPDVFLAQIRQQAGGGFAVSAPLPLPSQPVLPPKPPFDQLNTGVALGDFVQLCDGDSALVPVSGALDIGQPDARIIRVGGLAAGHLGVSQVLTVADGVGIAPFQIALAADCDTAFISNAFSGDITRISGLAGSGSENLTLETFPLASPFPAEPVITPNQASVLVHHPRVPLNQVPPALVTAYHAGDLAPAGEPMIGPVRAWLQAKDQTLAANPVSFVDILHASGLSWEMRWRIENQLHVAIWLSQWRLQFYAHGLLSGIKRSLRSAADKGRLSSASAQAMLDLIDVAIVKRH